MPEIWQWAAFVAIVVALHFAVRFFIGPPCPHLWENMKEGNLVEPKSKEWVGLWWAQRCSRCGACRITKGVA